MTAITISIWHNVRTDPEGRHLAMLDGYTPGDPMVRVFTYQAQPRGRTPEQFADDAFAAFNGHPSDAEGAALAGEYYGRQLRSLSVGDLVCVGEAPLVCERAGWAPLRGGITEARVDEHGTHPLPLPGETDTRSGGPGDPPRSGPHPGTGPATIPGDPATPDEGIPAVHKTSK